MASTKLKVVLVGEENVGKSSIIQRYFENSFNHQTNSTIGVDLYTKVVQLYNHSIKLMVWDTPGKERFRTLIPTYIRDSVVIVIVYDVTNSTSFSKTNKWIENIQQDNIGNENHLVILVANKTDLYQQRVISRKLGQEKANQYGIEYLETSAKSNDHITDLFDLITAYNPQSSITTHLNTYDTDESHVHVDINQADLNKVQSLFQKMLRYLPLQRSKSEVEHDVLLPTLSDLSSGKVKPDTLDTDVLHRLIIREQTKLDRKQLTALLFQILFMKKQKLSESREEKFMDHAADENTFIL
ncbi:P-loop containing nucleoside triphosphate hydrolase protein [Globomyces pollinis-pini]|nr:P-loop containing nucleoside triphosphate hydrolase protein [Globomyces pollinis-pini]